MTPAENNSKSIWKDQGPEQEQISESTMYPSENDSRAILKDHGSEEVEQTLETLQSKEEDEVTEAGKEGHSWSGGETSALCLAATGP